MSNHEHELRIEEHTATQRHSFAECLNRVTVEVRVKRAHAPLPQDTYIAYGVHIAKVDTLMTGGGVLPAAQVLIIRVTLSAEEMDAYLALRRQIIGRVLTALEVASA